MAYLSTHGPSSWNAVVDDDADEPEEERAAIAVDVGEELADRRDSFDQAYMKTDAPAEAGPSFVSFVIHIALPSVSFVIRTESARRSAPSAARSSCCTGQHQERRRRVWLPAGIAKFVWLVRLKTSADDLDAAAASTAESDSRSACRA